MADRRILDYRSRFGGAGHTLDQSTFAKLELRKLQEKGLMLPSIVLGEPDQLVEPPVLAQINSCNLGGRFGQCGRWLALCDESELPGACTGAEYIDLLMPRFMCCGCFNAGVGHRWRRVVLPAERDRGRIERLLLARPNAINHGWLPHETLADLQDQNLVLAAEHARRQAAR